MTASKYITIKSPRGNLHTYEIVEKIPYHFFVWNIGENMGTDKYIPICEPSNTKLSTGLCEINPDTLKAIRLKKFEVHLLREAASVGICSLSVARRAAQNEKSQENRKKLAKMVLPIFERITMHVNDCEY